MFKKIKRYFWPNYTYQVEVVSIHHHYLNTDIYVRTVSPEDDTTIQYPKHSVFFKEFRLIDESPFNVGDHIVVNLKEWNRI